MKAYLFLVVFLLASSNPENRWPLFLARGTVSVGGNLVCRYGYINNDGEWIVKPQFSFATGFYNGVAMGNPNAVSNRYLILADGVQVENKHFMRGDHFYDKELKSIVYCNRVSKVRGQLYIDMTPIGPRLKRLLFGKNRKRWLNVLFDAQGGSLQDGFTKSTHTGFIDHTGRVLFSFPLYNGHSYNWGARRPFSDGLAPYTISISKLRDDRTGYIDRNGKLVIKCFNLHYEGFREGLANYVDYETGKLGYISTNGKIVLKAKYYCRADFYEGMACVTINGKIYRNDDAEFYKYRKFSYAGDGWDYIFINKKGEKIINRAFTNAKRFSEGLAPVQIHTNGWQYINKTGRIVLQGDWKDAEPFKNGLARVTRLKNNRWVWEYINKKGKIIWQER